MNKPANDNHKRTIKPFPRMHTSGYLDNDSRINDRLHYCGERFKREYLAAARAEKQPAVNVNYDAYRDVALRIFDPAAPYNDAVKKLDELGLRQVVEAIIVHERDLVSVGRELGGRQHEQQARCWAITSLVIGLRVLNNLYKPPISLSRAA